MYNCDSAAETTLHFLLEWQQYQTIRLGLINSTYKLDPKIRNLSNDKLLKLFLYGSKLCCFKVNTEIIKLTVKFLKSSKRF